MIRLTPRFYFYPSPELERRRQLAREALVASGKHGDRERRATLRAIK